ncbi:amidohydrolase [Steroidobacter sp.]|uniref:amidohydrolase n=1 Tax=Steroidobacter sp. TaxID=1978227 RepID=UPI001A3DA80D|nr:amidohydrolase [Steroidobacter sp.]MBL8270672.1 amidohydrolase [Steroidobacter sp.]
MQHPPARDASRRPAVIPLLALLLSACATAPQSQAPTQQATTATTPTTPAPYTSTYKVPASGATLIRGATVLTGTGARIDGGDVLIVGGKIAAVGNQLSAPAGATTIEANGRWVTPGLIDVHSHLGVYSSPGVDAHSDGNEMVDPVTAQAWAEHALWPQDPGFQTALEGGVTTMQILPGSGNLIGGRGVTVKNVHVTTYQAMKFPGAPQGLKMACGENPKNFYGGKGQAPMTRMGNVAGYRQAFADAQAYREEWNKYRRELAAYEKKQKDPAGNKKDEDNKPPSPPKRDLKSDTLVGAMNGEILVHIHCYRADEMAIMIDLSKEFGFKIAAFHHAVEAYKIADVLAQQGICGAEWADWWGFKMEAFDGVMENLALTDLPRNGCAIVHSDSAEGIQRLNQEAAKAMARGNRAGLNISREHAMIWLTQNPAKALGIDKVTGTLETGKAGDVVIWNSDPFSVYALAEQVFIDGVLTYDRAHPPTQPPSDFMLGQFETGKGSAQ